MLTSSIEWQNTFENITNDKINLDITILSKFLDSVTTQKLELSSISNSTFIFNKSSFDEILKTIKVFNNKNESSIALATAWEIAMLTSNFMSLPGTYILPIANPTTIFSIITTITIEPTTLELAKQNLILDLTNLKPEISSFNFVNVFRNAFLNVNYIISGLNSITPTPTPLLINSKTI